MCRGFGWEAVACRRISQISYLTRLRREELASLSPSSFRMEATPPTLTVETKSSKQSGKDPLPMHPESVALVWGGWDRRPRVG